MTNEQTQAARNQARLTALRGQAQQATATAAQIAAKSQSISDYLAEQKAREDRLSLSMSKSKEQNEQKGR